jgi:hypothetical protein
MGESFFFFQGAVQSFGLVLWDVRVFCEGLIRHLRTLLFWSKGFSIGQLVIDCLEFICYLNLTSRVMSYYSLW